MSSRQHRNGPRKRQISRKLSLDPRNNETGTAAEQTRRRSRPSVQRITSLPEPHDRPRGDRTSCADAVSDFCASGMLNPDGKAASEVTTVKLHGMWPPIKEMDASLHQLVSCEHLQMSSNGISAITHVEALPKLRILSLSRNSISSIISCSLQSLCHLEQLHISYNYLDSLNGLEELHALELLDAGSNCITFLDSLDALEELAYLRELTLRGNPVQMDFVEAHGRNEWGKIVREALPQLLKFDGVPILEWKKTLARSNSGQVREMLHLIAPEGQIDSPQALRQRLRDPAVQAAVMNSPHMLALQQTQARDSVTIEQDLVNVYRRIDKDQDGILSAHDLNAAANDPVVCSEVLRSLQQACRHTFHKKQWNSATADCPPDLILDELPRHRPMTQCCTVC
eukprot:TRINITY_DN2014_c0_g1_i5.p1 TRINITY_DN2014_c0_g1~~TRINITY_DN2014_c0_g1_i5.p1  ORF type:complete len:397 (-),score=51.07 TRINITY_DN2014_c0_g1_i5:259-1449(-)